MKWIICDLCVRSKPWKCWGGINLQPIKATIMTYGSLGVQKVAQNVSSCVVLRMSGLQEVKEGSTMRWKAHSKYQNWFIIHWNKMQLQHWKIIQLATHSSDTDSNKILVSIFQNYNCQQMTVNVVPGSTLSTLFGPCAVSLSHSLKWWAFIYPEHYC